MNRAEAGNAALLAVAGVAAAAIFFAPVLVWPLPLWSIVPLAALTTPLHWGLLHEAIHSKLFSSERANRAAGRLLGIGLGLGFDAMRFGHLMHHRANRHSFDRPEEIPPGKSWLGRAPGFYFDLLGGGAFKSSTAPIPVLFPLPITRWFIARIFAGEDSASMGAAAQRAFCEPARRRRMREDFAATLALFALAFYLWGAAWPLLAAAIAARCCMLSLADNAPHYGTPRDSGQKARNTRLPPGLGWLVLNAHLHGAHHVSAELGWRELPAAFRHGGGSYDGGWTLSLLRQLRGPLHPPRGD